jgi:hypothetical protein
MSLYRQAGRPRGRTLLIAAVVALVVGLGGGYALGRATAPEPTLAENVADLRAKLGRASDGIELTTTEYGQAVRDGRIVAPTEYQAAQADVQRASDAVASVRTDLHEFDAARAAALENALAALAAAVKSKADPARVKQLSDDASTALNAVLGRG